MLSDRHLATRKLEASAPEANRAHQKKIHPAAQLVESSPEQGQTTDPPENPQDTPNAQSPSLPTSQESNRVQLDTVLESSPVSSADIKRDTKNGKTGRSYEFRHGSFPTGKEQSGDSLLSSGNRTRESRGRDRARHSSLPTDRELSQRARKIHGQPILRIRASEDDESFVAQDIKVSISTLVSRVSFNPNVTFHAPSPPRDKEYRGLKRRWYILALYSAFTCGQVCVRQTFGPLSSSAIHAFGFDKTTIALLNGMGSITFLISGVFFCWLLNSLGLRPACVLSSGLVAMGTMIRCFANEQPVTSKVLMIIGHFLNGLGGPVAMSGAPKLSACWFPLSQRATATTIGTSAFYLGIAFSLFIGLYLMPAEASAVNSQVTTQTSFRTRNNSFHNSTSWTEHTDAEFSAFQMLFFCESVWTVAVFGLMLLYFPNLPNKAPSASSEQGREDFVRGFKHIIRDRVMWLMASIYTLSVGIACYWSSLMSSISGHVSQDGNETRRMEFYATLSSLCLSLAMAWFVDKYLMWMKRLVVTLLIAGSVCFVTFLMVFNKIIPTSVEVYYVLVIAGLSCVVSTAPIISELSCEHAFPVGEGLTVIFLTYVYNIQAFVFFVSTSLKWIEPWAVNAVLVTAVPFAFILLVSVDQRFDRRDMDLRAR